jgi:DNA-directed RNA polymerase specialized sigma24 family protein
MGGTTAEEVAAKEGVSATAIRIRFFRARRAALASLEGRAAERRRSLLDQDSAVA